MTVDAKTQRFRTRYRRDTVGAYYSGALHVLATAVILGGGAAGCFAQAQGLRPWHAALVAGTLVLAQFIEYAGHRWLMHQPRRWARAMYRRHVRVHHRYFPEPCMHGRDWRDVHATLVSPIQLVVYLGIAAVLAVATGMALGPAAGWVVAGTALGWQLVFEGLHLAWHAPKGSWLDRQAWLEPARAHHRRHHALDRMNHGNFSVGLPLIDPLAGTALDADESWIPSPASPE
jgi:uncharacterized membrane protein